MLFLIVCLILSAVVYGSTINRYNYTIEECRLDHGLLSSGMVYQKGKLVYMNESHAYNSGCKLLYVQIHLIDLSHYLQLLPSMVDVDNDLSINEIEILLVADVSNHYQEIGKIVDEFLIPRPWFRIVNEPYQWNAASSYNSVIQIHRYAARFDYMLKTIAAVQYPPTESICEKSHLLLSSMQCIHPGWASVMAYYNNALLGPKTYVYTVYFPNKKIEGIHKFHNAFMSIKDCNETNIWNCAFLKTTNCTIPKDVIDCNNSTCFSSTFGMYTYLSSASSSGKYVHPEVYEKEGNRVALTPQQEKYMSSTDYNKGIMWYHRVISDQMAAAHPQIAITNYLKSMVFILRKAYFYRSKVREIVNDYRVGHNFPVSTRCIAAHIRRGDRVIYNHKNEAINMTEYCYNISNPISKDQRNICYINRSDNKYQSCPDHAYDFGCGDGNRMFAYAAVTLSEIIKRVEVIGNSEVYDIVVSTDDPMFIRSEVELLNKINSTTKYRIHTLQPPTATHLTDMNEYYHYLRSSAETQSGLFLFSSIELMTPCEGFIGHWGSQTSALMFQQVCADKNGVCPTMINLESELFK